MASENLYPVRKIRDLKDMLAQSCSMYGDKTAFLIREGDDKYREISYSRFGKDVEALGAAFLKMGLKGGLVAVLGENRYEWCVTYLSVINGVGTIVPLDKELPSDEVLNLLNRCEANTVIFSGKYRNQMKGLAGRIPSVRYYVDMDSEQDGEGFLSFRSLLESGRALLKSGENGYRGIEINPDGMSALIFTSGTTDLAKGVMLSHRNICTNITSVCSTVKINSGDVALSVLPIHHTYECSLGFLAMIYNGGTIAFNDGLKHISRNLQEVKPTFMVTVPLLLENMHRKIMDKVGKKKLMRVKFRAALFFTNLLNGALRIDIRKRVFKSVHESLGGRMRLMITGAAAIKPEVSKCFREMGIQVLQGYGLTECAPLVAGNRDGSFVDNAGGLPIPGVQIKICNPDNTGIGEIAVKGDNVMLGYYRNAAATNSSIRDGWFHTGDLGYQDKKGFLYITGRLKNVIVTKNGKKIFPEEIETYINRSPFVQESLVYGKYEQTSGESFVYAQILPNIKAIGEKLKLVNASKEELKKIISEVIKNTNREMPLYKRIRKFTIREKEFAKTTTQKIKRYMETSKAEPSL